MSEEEVSNPSRRRFLKLGLYSAVGTAAVIGAGGILNANNLLPSVDSDIPNINVDNPDDPSKHWGFVIDLSKCDSCESQSVPEDDPTGEKQRCSYACRKYHNFLAADPPQYWIRVYKLEGTKGVDHFNFPKPCQNCQDAPCKRVCPTGATYQRKDGTILINHDLCIGCRICMAACPYETRFFWYNDPPKEKYIELEGHHAEHAVNHQKGTVAKCDLCVHQAYKNQLPHCVSACPQSALYFGNLNEDAVSNGKETIAFHETINNRSGYRYKEDEGTETSIYYLPVIKN
ncbi:MAG: Tetrathionate reductase subunit B precursor [Candidatus Heimdallarchaeota archaeon LC_2]|nr:MAG: Tetrathionate reductase subunit B precursor [Candidatus Heimdallarchaeota archaeon LC_2]